MGDRTDLEFTSRGFAVYGRGEDAQRVPWRVQESSIAGEHHCWLFAGDRSGNAESGSLHLNVDLVRLLLTQLQSFLREQRCGHVHGEGRCVYGIHWKLLDETMQRQYATIPLCRLIIDGELKGGGTTEERRQRAELMLSFIGVTKLQDALGRFLIDAGDDGHWKNDSAYAEVWRPLPS